LIKIDRVVAAHEPEAACVAVTTACPEPTTFTTAPVGVTVNTAVFELVYVIVPLLCDVGIFNANEAVEVFTGLTGEDNPVSVGVDGVIV
jgi:hypothetical protein